MPKKHLWDHHFTLGSIAGDVFMLILGYVAVLLTALMRGGHGRASILGIHSCSVHSWLIFLAGNIACCLCTLVSFRKHSGRLTHADDPEEASRG